MDIDKIFIEYQQKNGELIEYIQKIAVEKQKSGDWDLGVEGQSNNLVFMLMYEYASSIEKLTKGKITAKQVINKLSNQMGKLRIGDYRLGKDDNITYDGKSVTSDEYKRECRMNKTFGAHAIEYTDKDDRKKFAVVLFDNRQLANIDGKEQRLSGINLDDLSDIRQTVFHEWTHVMEKSMISASKLSKEDVIYKERESTYINSMLSPDLSKQEYEDYVSNIDELMKSDEEIPFSGISTIELNDRKNPNSRIMHNQISEGATEFIARKVMEIIGEKVKHKERYFRQVKIVGDIFKGQGLADTITTYFTEPNVLIKSLESIKVKDKDMLHYISDYINSPHLSKMLNIIKIDKNGKVKEGIIGKVFDKIKRFFSRKNVKMLLPKEEKTNQSADDNDEYLKSLIVSPEQLEKKQERPGTGNKEITKQAEDKEDKNLND